ncbi:MAG: hypothetical protein JWL83_4211 [Actinomycetia bacterium]|nr:hypothetical protein [Actinomycetes bacterium]
MRRLLLVAVVTAALLTSCVPPGGGSGSAADLKAWNDKLVHVTPPPKPPPLVRGLLNIAIRAGVPVVCPALVAQAAPDFRAFVQATCDAIVASDDPFTTVTQTLPALCAGDPPIGATVFPNLALAITATCPLIVTLPALLNVAQYVPLF